MLNKKGIYNITSMLVTSSIVASIIVVGWKAYESGFSNASSSHQSQVFIYLQSLMNEIYQEENPNAWPPESVVPEQIETWVMPTNLQNAGELEDLLRQYCRTFDGKPDFLGNGNFTCKYTLIVGGSTNVPPSDDSGGGGGGSNGGGGGSGGSGHGGVPASDSNGGSESIDGSIEDDYEVKIDSTNDSYCINKRFVKYKKRTQNNTSTDCDDPSYTTLYESGSYATIASMQQWSGGGITAWGD